MTSCPCGSPKPLADCCGPIIAGTRPAATPEQLMCSRFTAFTQDNTDYLLHSWHPATRPASIDNAGIRWHRLFINDIAGNTVTFTATFTEGGERGRMTETSTFTQIGEDSRWVYLSGVHL